MIVLGDEKGHQYLPEILPQDADTPAEIGGGGETGVAWVNGGPDGGVVGVQVEITVPVGGEFFLRAGEGELLPPLPDGEGVGPRGDEIATPLQWLPGKALARGGNLV